MKKLFVWFVVVAMVLMFAGCGAGAEADAGEVVDIPEDDVVGVEVEDPEEVDVAEDEDFDFHGMSREETLEQVKRLGFSLEMDVEGDWPGLDSYDVEVATDIIKDILRVEDDSIQVQYVADADVFEVLFDDAAFAVEMLKADMGIEEAVEWWGQFEKVMVHISAEVEKAIGGNMIAVLNPMNVDLYVLVVADGEPWFGILD